MKGTGSTLSAHQAGETTTLAHCWKVTRRDGTVFGFTDHTSDLVVDSVTYESLSGFLPHSVPTTSGMNVDTTELSGGFISSAITDADIRAGLWSGAKGELFQVNYKDLTMGIDKLRKFELGEVRSGRFQFMVELRGLMYKMQQHIGREISPACQWDLGSPQCGIDLNTFPNGRAAVAVASPVGSRRYFKTTSGHVINWFTNGRAEFTSGLNAGLMGEIKIFHSDAFVELQEPMPYDVQVGDTLILQVGCNKDRSGDCKLKFNNVPRHGGFPDLPGLDAAVNGL